MISIRNLTKSYKTAAGRHYVFRDVTVDFPADVNIGILGPNGAGKSTLLRILGGIDHPDSGTVHCDRSMSWPLGLRGGFVGTLSGRENCRLICTLYGLDNRTTRRTLEFIKELSGIDSYFEEPVRGYSTGMAGRVGFALSMAFDFEILLIDEMTSAGDRNFKDRAKQVLDEKRGRSHVLMVSHSMASIREFCDVGILLRNGQLTPYDNLDDAVRAYLSDDPGTDDREEDVGDSTLDLDGSWFPRAAREEGEPASVRNQVRARLVRVEQALADDDEIPHLGAFHHLLGRAYDLLGHLVAAADHHARAVEVTPERANHHLHLAKTLLALARLEEAEQALHTALDLWPRDPGLLGELYQLQSRTGRWREALETAETASGIKPDNPNFLHQCALARLALGEANEPLRLVQRCLQRNADNPAYYRTLARALTTLQRHGEATLALREAQAIVREQTLAKANELNRTDRQDSSLRPLEQIRNILEKATDLLP